MAVRHTEPLRNRQQAKRNTLQSSDAQVGGSGTTATVGASMLSSIGFKEETFAAVVSVIE